MLRSSTLILIILIPLYALGQVQPSNIDIVRDSFGVPHIFAPTDEEVAYGLAWATAEDDFKTIQEQLLPIKGLAGLVNGKNGAIFDVAVHILDPSKIVEEDYETALSPKFKNVLESYVEGINRYASLHPEEVMHKKLFPAHPKDVLKAYILGMALLSHADKPIFKILGEDALSMGINETRGSNAFAINSRKSMDGNTYMAINSHQPLEGLNSWYEAHLCSEEGWNIIGSNFVGGVSIFHGTNEHLSWAHTVNHADFADVYKLEMHPDKKHVYKFNNEWLELESYHTKARIKLFGFLPFGLKQKFYKSVFGTTFITDEGVFALRITANQTIKTAEQWYQMNKATNYSEFRQALEMQGITCTNIVYADKDDNIFYISNGLLPERKQGLDWKKIVMGTQNDVLWDSFYPIDSLPQVLNPKEGYVYNCNHSPFLSADMDSNPKESQIPSSMGYQTADILTNRGERFYTLINEKDKINYQQFKDIRADRYFEKPMDSAPKLEVLFNLDPEKYPQHAASIKALNIWDREFSESSHEASIVVLVINHLFKNGINNDDLRAGEKLTEFKLIAAINFAENHLVTNFMKTEVPLAELQIHSRANTYLPFAGGPDVMAAVYSSIQEDGTVRPIAGDSYIQMVQWTENGPIIESINAYGASNHTDSPHHTDQMELFTQQKLKPMTLDKKEVYKQAKSIYHPK